MKRYFSLLAVGGLLVTAQVHFTEALGAAMPPTGVRTNFVDRWITNTTEVQMQVNRFVTEFHTNWVSAVHTNVVDVFSTNVVRLYMTNRVQLQRTNYVELYSTNIIAHTVTNHLVLDRIQTNMVTAYFTNLKTLHLTNWVTVVSLKTNWTTKPITNVVEIDVPQSAPALPSASVLGSPPAKSSTAAEPLALEAARSPRSTSGNQVEVQLKVSWSEAPTAPVQVQQWRIEREDGSILCFGQDPEFKRVLPTGTYKVLVRAQRNTKSPLVAALGTLTVTSREVLLEQRPARSNTSI